MWPYLIFNTVSSIINKIRVRVVRFFRKIMAHAAEINDRIPKKGRIRLLLAVAAVAIGVRWYSAIRHARAARSTVAQKILKYNEISTAGIRELVQQNPPVFTPPSDTVAYRGSASVIHYSIDTLIQAHVKKLLRQYHPRYAAVAAIDPVTGRMITLVSYTNEENTPKGDNLFCRSIFPAASIFKIITTAAVIEKKKPQREQPAPLSGKKTYALQIPA